MGFTGVVWDSRSTEQLARDLTEGPGPASVGQTGAAWVRVANEFAAVTEDYRRILDRLRTAYESTSASAALSRLEEFGEWLRAASLSAAANGQKAEEAAVANTVAVLAMPSVAEAVEARAAHDMMASLAAYNGAVLNGTFAEFDESATADNANAAAVMTQYEEACVDLAQPWEQPPPPDVTNGNALKAEKDAEKGSEGAGSGAGGGAGGGGGVGTPLSPMLANGIKSSGEAKALTKAGAIGGSLGSSGGMGGGGYGPMAGMHRGSENGRDYSSSTPESTLEGGGEEGAGVSGGGEGWLPAAAPSDAPFQVSNVSWGPNSSVFDELAVPDEPAAPGYAEEPEGTLEQVSGRWTSPPVIGVDKELSV
jgi:hypothetical protein